MNSSETSSKIAPPSNGNQEYNSQYGSLDSSQATTARDFKNTENVNYSPLHVAQQANKASSNQAQIQEPPKPAVRQRSATSKQQRQVEQLIKQDSSNPDRKEQQVLANQEKVLIELSKSLQATRNNQLKLNGASGKLKSAISSPLALEQIEDDLLEAKRQPDELLDKMTTNVVSLPKQPTRPYPKNVFFIVANEFCERFSFYGLKTVLVLYFKSALNFTDSNATISFHLFATLCYLTPILGAILGDSVFGKFKTILYFSIIYFLGELLLLLSSIFWDRGFISIFCTFVSLFFVGLGTGGIKPCVSALGGDQFLSNEEKRRQLFFSLFYGAINLGSLISMFATPMLRSNFRCVGREDCYPYAFGLPCLLMFIGIIVFLMAKNQYTIVPLPERNVILEFSRCLWLAFKRKLTGHRLAPDQEQQIRQYYNHKQSISSDNTSSSNLSISSNEDSSATTAPNSTTKLNKDAQFNNNNNNNNSTSKQQATIASHWLYLASDQFDLKSIESFRAVLGILLLFVPLPVYWCLYDQQSSLWTLQAARMDGKIFNSFVLQPDQISIANPLILLSAIPIFEAVIYPNLAKFNLLTRPIQRMTLGGILAAITFIVSALIEIKIQNHMLPVNQVQVGRANLIFVNGLSECSMIEPTISYVPVTSDYFANTTGGLLEEAPQIIDNHSVSQSNWNSNSSSEWISAQADGIVIRPFSHHNFNLLSGDLKQLNSYRLKFKMTDAKGGTNHAQISMENSTAQQLLANSNNNINCPFDPATVHEFNIKPLQEQSSNLFYLEQGNGRLNYKMFHESLELPPTGKARVRLIYESFGSFQQGEKRSFYLLRGDEQQTNSFLSAPKSSSGLNSSASVELLDDKLKFKFSIKNGQVFLSDYLDVELSARGEWFTLRSEDNSLKFLIDSSKNGDEENQVQTQAMPNKTSSTNQNRIFLEPGTRNLLILNQKNSTTVEMNLRVLQDNSYRISMLYQLIPYLLISISEVMFSITGLEFSYSMAPDNMKSLILGSWCLTTAFGNMLTVAIESLHIFPNIAYDFLFYATIMAADMVLFAIIGYNYRPFEGSLPLKAS